jgi:fatty acid desaturase
MLCFPFVVVGARSARRVKHHRRESVSKGDERDELMVKFLLWLILLVICWPLAFLALVLYPIVWILLLPFRLLGMTVDAIFEFLKALLFLPARLLAGTKVR